MTPARLAGRRRLRVDRIALAEFACLIRPDWSRADLDGVIYRALRGLGEQEARDRFAALVLHVARLAGIDDSAAFDLRHENRYPVLPPGGPPADPRAIPEAAAMLDRAHAAIADRPAGGTR